jgi:hypothetical protein
MPRPLSGGCPRRPPAPLAGVPPLPQTARVRVSVLVEVAGDPPRPRIQIALCYIGQLLLAHAAAMNVIRKADVPLTWVQPLRQGAIDVVLDSDELTRLIDIARDIRDGARSP